MVMVLETYLRGIGIHVEDEQKMFEMNPQWNTLKEVYLYLTGKKTDYLTNTGKMSNGSFGFSASNCNAGGYLKKLANSICSICYGDKGCYAFKNYKTKSKRTIESLSKTFWKEAMLFIIKHKEFKEFRWFDNGDLQSDKMLRDIFYIAEHTPDVKHWLPTKEYRMVRRVIEGGLHKPDNLDIRLSAFNIDGSPPLKLARRLGVNCSVALTPEEFNKRNTKGLIEVKCHVAHSITDKILLNTKLLISNYKETRRRLLTCNGCTACYENKVDVVYYEVH